jgi:hypothetical protein
MKVSRVEKQTPGECLTTEKKQELGIFFYSWVMSDKT